jgi:hypothetical protein
MEGNTNELRCEFRDEVKDCMRAYLEQGYSETEACEMAEKAFEEMD